MTSNAPLPDDAAILGALSGSSKISRFALWRNDCECATIRLLVAHSRCHRHVHHAPPSPISAVASRRTSCGPVPGWGFVVGRFWGHASAACEAQSATMAGAAGGRWEADSGWGRADGSLPAASDTWDAYSQSCLCGGGRYANRTGCVSRCRTGAPSGPPPVDPAETCWL